MAGRSSSLSMVASNRLFAPVHAVGGADHGVELDEADVIWGAGAGGPASSSSSPSSSSPFLSSAADQYARSPPLAAPSKPKPRSGGTAGPASVPVNIPDWSKILGDEYRAHHHGGNGAAASGDWEVDDADDDDALLDGGTAALVPPHELAWRRRAASLSVDGGAGGVVGRTLKVRDAVWKRTTGFQD